MVNYSELPGLDGVYLEDSFVLGIGETSNQLVFDLDAVLTPSHPSYAPPHPGEQYCYRRGELLFRTTKSAGSLDRKPAFTMNPGRRIWVTSTSLQLRAIATIWKVTGVLLSSNPVNARGLF
jgi:hypothetical protein